MTRRSTPGLPLRTARADLLALPFPDGAFDGVFAQGSFFMLGERRERAAREWARVLKPGGVLGVSRHSPQQVTLEDTAQLLRSAGLTVELAALHPDGARPERRAGPAGPRRADRPQGLSRKQEGHAPRLRVPLVLPRQSPGLAAATRSCSFASGT